ncbi:MAG TPA: 6-phosphogluconolactonase [Woeseiaceae bacterium]
MKIHIEPDADRLALECAGWMAGQVRLGLAERDTFSLALSGGRGPHGMFEALAREKVPWSRVHLFQVDERAAPADSPDRNLTAIRSLLAERVAIPPGNVHPMPVEQDDLEAAAREYADTLARVLGPGAILDLVHLGLGEDGHTASLLPGDPVAGSERTVIVSREYGGFRRMSLNYTVLSDARQRVWLVTGTAKSEMLLRAMDGDVTIPAGRIRREDTLFFADQAAGALLEG